MSNLLNFSLMANYNQGILGPFSGKVGPVVGSTWKGRQVMKGRPYPKKNVTPSILQARVQQRLTAISNYLRPLGGLISLGMRYVAKAAAVTPRNYATKRNMEDSMNLSHNVWSVIPSTIKISEGQYGAVTSVLLTEVAQGFSVSWTNNGGAVIGMTAGGRQITLADTDKVWVALYNVEKNQVALPNTGFVMRDDAVAVVAKPAGWTTGDHVHAYVFTMAEVVYNYNTEPENMTDEQIALAKEYIEQGYVFSETVNSNITLS
ncbi:MAG: hypothetical protein II267_04600 [Paludibacteraceae bacterium]|nr:hypothetical protein [Paludibacteraceae bacterium]MBQ2439152.1 hypothetical protein [Paludibacteraceae bacterium]